MDKENNGENGDNTGNLKMPSIRLAFAIMRNGKQTKGAPLSMDYFVSNSIRFAVHWQQLWQL
jgi:hypothetical protein